MLQNRFKFASGLVTTSLQKRLLSSVEAFALTLGVHRRAFEKRLAERNASTAPVPSEQDLSLLISPPGGDDDRADIAEDEVRGQEASQAESAPFQTIPAKNKQPHTPQLLK